MLTISGPQWFHGLDYYFELFAFIITFFIALYALRVFTLTWDRKYLYFTLAFVSISANYAIRAPMDWFLYRNFLPNVPNLARAVSVVVETPVLHQLAIILSSLFLLSGFLLLAAVYLGLKDPKVLLLLEAGLIVILMSQFFIDARAFYILLGHLLLILMLAFIISHLFSLYTRHKTTSRLIVIFAMSCLLLAHASYILIPYINEYLYGVGHGLQLLGYVLLLANILLVFKK
jgi:hypothetical protein